MKFELDTAAKTVKLLGDATLGEVNEILEKVLGDEAKNYRLITTATNYNPIWISQPYVIPPYVRWWADPVYCGTSTGTTLTTGNTGTSTAFLCETGSNGITVTNLSN